MGRIANWRRGIRDVLRVRGDLAELHREVSTLRLATGKMLAEDVRRLETGRPIRDAEFRVFSQFGEDGILQYMAANAGLLPGERRFVEIGVEDYREANTRFLLENDHWEGAVVEANPVYLDALREDPVVWREGLSIVESFVTRENVNEVVRSLLGDQPLGLLSIDIDGNDYWVWEALNVVRPVMVVVEYNAILGGDRSLAIPYNPRFTSPGAHASGLYWGASLPAMVRLAERKGFVFVGVESHGVNAFFVREDRAEKFRKETVAGSWTLPRTRIERDGGGGLTFRNPRDSRSSLKGLNFVEPETGKPVRWGEE